MIWVRIYIPSQTTTTTSLLLLLSVLRGDRLERWAVKKYFGQHNDIITKLSPTPHHHTVVVVVCVCVCVCSCICILYVHCSSYYLDCDPMINSMLIYIYINDMIWYDIVLYCIVLYYIKNYLCVCCCVTWLRWWWLLLLSSVVVSHTHTHIHIKTGEREISFLFPLSIER